MLKLYNTLTRTKEVFRPLKKGKVGLYTCGPTVYNFAHVGNLRTYVFEDILRRVLLYSGYKVKHVMNITDVGHLTSDADEGEDKMEKARRDMLYFKCKECGKDSPSFMAVAKEFFGSLKYENNHVECVHCKNLNTLNKKDLFYIQAKPKFTIEDIANKYTQDFKDDMKKLNLLEPKIWCKATGHIKEMIKLVEKLEKNGLTYKTSDGIYFNTSKFKDYGKLARLDMEGLQEGARVEKNAEKKNPTDFALWKFSPKGGKRVMEWKSPWGIGFPGWHIECSAMAMKYLGETFDMHCGGIDHVSVHHTNEIAQSEGATGKKFVNYWLHGDFLNVKGGDKMAKSGENFVTLQSLVDRNFDPLAYRYLLLTAHYRSKIDFSWESLQAAQNALHKLYDALGDYGQAKVCSTQYDRKFTEVINDDLDMPRAMALVWQLVKDKNIDASCKKSMLLKFDKVLGLGLDKVKKCLKTKD